MGREARYLDPERVLEYARELLAIPVAIAEPSQSAGQLTLFEPEALHRESFVQKLISAIAGLELELEYPERYANHLSELIVGALQKVAASTTRKGTSRLGRIRIVNWRRPRLARLLPAPPPTPSGFARRV